MLGFTHIVPRGLDHVLFVLGIYLLERPRAVGLWQVSAFTIAHSITPRPEHVRRRDRAGGDRRADDRAVDRLCRDRERVPLGLRSWRLALVFAFGLLHGLGFAGALKELGLPRSEFLTALVTFNVGVEAGQLTVIAAAFLLVGWHCRARDWYAAAS